MWFYKDATNDGPWTVAAEFSQFQGSRALRELGGDRKMRTPSDLTRAKPTPHSTVPSSPRFRARTSRQMSETETLKLETEWHQPDQPLIPNREASAHPLTGEQRSDRAGTELPGSNLPARGIQNQQGCPVPSAP